LMSSIAFSISFFFFFHAEVGIRDFHVTGVQTCALPICRWLRRLLWLPVCFVLLTLLQVLPLRWIDPPTSAFMLARQIEGIGNEEIGRAARRDRAVSKGRVQWSQSMQKANERMADESTRW